YSSVIMLPPAPLSSLFPYTTLFRSLGGALGLQDDAPAHHDVPAPLVELDDLELVALAEELVDVGHPAQRDLAAGEEGVHPHDVRSEEHTSELQSRFDLVCRLLLEKK